MKTVLIITIALFIISIFPGCNETNKSKNVNLTTNQISSDRIIEVIDSVKLNELINNRKGKLLFHTGKIQMGKFYMTQMEI